MHLLAAKPGGFSDEEGIVDLQQSPADIVILSAQDTTLSLLVNVADQLPASYPSVRIANLLHLIKPASLDLYIDKVLQHSKVIIVSLLGGRAYWPYGVESLVKLQERGIVVAFVPGDDQADPDLVKHSNAPPEFLNIIWRYLREGGLNNAKQLYAFLQNQYFDASVKYDEPKLLAKTLIYHHDFVPASVSDWQSIWQRDKSNQELNPVAAVLFYRSHVQSGNTKAFDGLCQCLLEQGMNPLPIATSSLKEPVNIDVINKLLVENKIAVIVNTTSFSVGLADCDETDRTLFGVDVPVIQAIMAGTTEQDWRDATVGLRSSDIAMNVALPEIDGRIISRAISFKEIERHSDRTQSDVISYRLNVERARFVARLAKSWASLREKHNSQKRITLVLANYPTSEGRIGNGVGLDTPASVINLLQALQDNNYSVKEIPQNTKQLMSLLLAGVTNDSNTQEARYCWQSISVQQYKEFFHALPQSNQQAVIERWGEVEDDPRIRLDRIMISGIRLDNIFVGIQPSRGYDVDISANYHDPDLIPPHSYLAFYFWLRHVFNSDAIVHVGKHGNLEWLPGKGVGLSENCWPDISLGPMPHLYPFIVNDPGEGSQAKRRAQAVIVDHLTPPMTRAETYGVLHKLENLVDEYYQAMGMDQRRATHLKQEILSKVKQHNIEGELAFDKAAEDQSVLNELDTYLCELKEAQIRDGLHILGESPVGQQQIDTLVALSRNISANTNVAGLLDAMAKDFGFDDTYEPMTANPSAIWDEVKPLALDKLIDKTWRHHGDTRERLELMAQSLVQDFVVETNNMDSLETRLAVDCPNTKNTLQFIQQQVSVKLAQSGQAEIKSMIAGLAGKFIQPGPSGAPTRGRLDVLPTGRNFYSVDTRSIPTPTAWTLGQASANNVIHRYMQDHGDYPKQIGLSVWGTSTMRTGGDDIAQAFALMGVKPIWDAANNRVINIEIIPGFILARPRVDVTLRISGFFRDAFPNVVKLYDLAVQTLIDYEEPGHLNTIRANVLKDRQRWIEEGMDAEAAKQKSAWRIFGSKPGAYGAGLKGLIDQRCWQTEADLAQAYLNWGGYAYSGKQAGEPASDEYRNRLSQTELVLQNQDNREHDILDSDDYYQFQGGMANAVTEFSGEAPEIFHGDHSNPSAPKIRTLKQELDRVVRSRVVNPKWLNAARRHGYKGAFEMAATVDYLFAYDATTKLVGDYQYELVAQHYLYDQTNIDFLKEHNPNAFKEMAERLIEAMQRGLWQSPGEHRERIEDLLLEADGILETV